MRCGAEYEVRSYGKYCTIQCMIRARTTVASSGCWNWNGYRNADGYGVGSWRTRASEKAHRLAYRGFIGDIIGGEVCHRCDNRACCNPDHLFIGTHRENVDDCVNKRRHTHGTKQHTAKLTDEMVREIRASGDKQAALARRYGVSDDTIRRVRRREFWRHVE